VPWTVNSFICLKRTARARTSLKDSLRGGTLSGWSWAILRRSCGLLVHQTPIFQWHAEVFIRGAARQGKSTRNRNNVVIALRLLLF
jgi:hypothetical protein